MCIRDSLYAKASKDERTEVPLSELRVGLKCGGSDGFSGITANPLLGMFSDFLIAQGGTSVLTEVPEMFGAETILMNRCENKDLFEQTVHLINDFKEYFLSHGEPVGENPSPGNKAGGISTLEEKALGCTQKCGKSYVSGVMPYGERLQKKGLNLLSAPGNDLVAATTPVSYTHLEAFKAVLLSKASPSPIPVMVWDNIPELRIGSLVIILIVPAMADDPNKAEPPPRITSTRSIMLAGICSMPYTPESALKIGRESSRICV